MKIGFIGPGNIGRGIVTRLLNAEQDVVIWARTKSKVQDLLELGAEWADSPTELVEKTKIVLSCLLSSEVARKILLEDQLLANATADHIFVEHGTFPPELAEEFAVAAQSSGAGFIDCPVSGGPDGALNGTLSLMAGGATEHVNFVRPILELYGSLLVHVGPVGSGQKLKLINQTLVVGNTMVAAEATAAVLKAGLVPEAALAGLSAGWAQSTMLERTFQRVVEKDFYNSGANIGAMSDILAEVAQFLRDTDVNTPVFNQIRSIFDQATGDGQRDEDLAAIVKMVEPGLGS